VVRSSSCRQLLRPPKEGSLKIESDTNRRGVGKTVLVVDDNAPIRKMLVAAFLSDGFKKCEEAANGKEAIEIAKQTRPDVVVLDYSMPGLTGLQVASLLRELFPAMPLMLFTLYASKTMKTEAAKVGINVVLSKNVPVFTILDKAHELMG
jgi:CheY-like chemotaxis protein